MMANQFIDQPTSVRPGEELDRDRLLDYLDRHLPDGEAHRDATSSHGELEVLQFPGGFSNLTYLLRLGERELVLRRPPFGSKVKGAHDMGREYRILSRLAGVFAKVPRPFLYCEDEQVLGAPFYVMERIRGVILRPRMDPAAAPDAQRMARIADEFLSTLVELHQVDLQAAGLGDLGHPEGYVGRQIEGWVRRYSAARTDDVPDLERIAIWLPEHLPPSSGAALIHNDYKYDNLVLDPESGVRVLAVLDWEMATSGDPLMDLGTSLAYWLDPDDPPEIRALERSPTTSPGNPGRLEIAQRYARLTGHDLTDLVFYYVYGLFKIAVLGQQIYARYRQGHTRDHRFAAMIDGVRGFARVASQAVDKQRIDRLF